MPAKKSSSTSAPSKPTFHAARLPIEKVAVVGAGGTGSIFMSHLCRIWQAWVKLGGTPFEVELFDPDTVSEANLARQCFCAADIGQPKALVLAQRLRAFYGVPVTPITEKFLRSGASLIAGCVDNLAARRAMRDDSKQEDGCYWLDMGNTAHTGQVILGGHGLPDFFDIFPQLLKAKDPKDTPSCSMAEALERQDLFINSTVATLAGQLLWKLLRTGQLTHHGFFINLQTGRTSPLNV